MLQSACSHSRVLPQELCLLCTSNAPESLLDICSEYIVNHIETICDIKPFSEELKLHEGIALPLEICEKLLQTRLNKRRRLDSGFCNIYRNKFLTRLKRVKIRNTDLNDGSLKIFLQHRLIELDVSQSPCLTEESLRHISAFGNTLVSLTIGDNTNLFPKSMYLKNKHNCFDTGYVILAPNLKRLALKNLEMPDPEFFQVLLKPLPNLTHLDLSNCNDLGRLQSLAQLPNLVSLVLYNVYKIEELIPGICKLAALQHLDVSQSREHYGRFKNGNNILATLVAMLPNLVSLDISGTNLAGRGVAECGLTLTGVPSDIPGLNGRVSNPFQFLGLYETKHDACRRHDIPAKLISGNANEQQILVSAVAYQDRPEVLRKVLDDLFHVCRFETFEHIGQCISIVLNSMSRHITEKHIQISGSATLFYIVKGTSLDQHIRVKRRIISTLLNAMFEHRSDETMMRNGCLTICQFKIPQDVLFEYERLVTILLHSVHGMQQESFVQRIGIYLLNSLACQVDGVQKQKLGELGVIVKMIALILDRLDRGICDDVLEVAWSTMWNVTDETPQNCKRFLESHGMEFFLRCLRAFPDKEELLRNMMGLLGNVAEVRDLRHYLMKAEYVSVFSELLDSSSDGIEVSYNAAGVISHMASDGPLVWAVKHPSRETVLKRMIAAIERWDLNAERNINYRSFEPILYLVMKYETPECQLWAVWALANLTKVYPSKYCCLVESEGGIVLLEQLLQNTMSPTRIKQLASIVIENCRQFREQDYIESNIFDG